jgi:hypothetical protein
VTQFHESRRNFLGINVDGRAQIGQYFSPLLWTAVAKQEGERGRGWNGSVIPADGTSHEWSLSYDPAANNGLGAITVTFDNQTTTLNLTDQMRREGATFDRFGMFTSRMGGGRIKIWLDDLQYTARAHDGEVGREHRDADAAP